MSEEKKTLIEKIKANKILQYFLIALLIIVIFAVVFSGLFLKNESNPSSSAIDLYVSNLEEKLSKTLSDVDGAGKVSVVITVESGMETVLAMKTSITETPNGTEKVETPILVNGKTVVLKENYPKIIGVLIVAEGAKSISVTHKIQQAAISLLDIDINQIEILTMK